MAMQFHQPETVSTSSGNSHDASTHSEHYWLPKTFELPASAVSEHHIVETFFSIVCRPSVFPRLPRAFELAACMSRSSR